MTKLPRKKSVVSLIPIIRDTTKKYFVDAHFVRPRLVEYCGETVFTAPLVFGKTINLLDLSRSVNGLAKHLISMDDQIPPFIVLRRVYVDIPTEGVAMAVDFTDPRFHDAPKDKAYALRAMLIDQTVTLDYPSSNIDHRKQFRLTVKGTLNLETGGINLKATADTKEVTPLGYEVDAYRDNPNRKHAA